jgi:arginase
MAMTTSPFTTLGIPIDSVGLGTGGARGTERSPAALRDAGLGRLGWADAGDLDVRITDAQRDPTTGLVGSDGVLSATTRIREALRDRVVQGERPFLLGGCCTLLPGALAGVRDAIGPLGLVYVDGHLDLYDGQTSPTGEAADMPIAVLLGTGPPSWNERVAPLPVVQPRSVALLGHRDPDERIELDQRLEELRAQGLLATDAQEVIRDGPAAVAQAATAHVAGDGLPLWFHVDLDVLDEVVFPATDYLMPGGLDWQALVELLRPMAAMERLVGWSLSCYNPDKDPDGASGRALVEALEAVFHDG